MFRTLLCGCYIHRGFYNAVTVYGCIWIDVFRMLLLYMVVYGYMFRTLLCGCYIHRGFYNAVTVYGCIWIDV